jgi:hypothetical protein
MNYTRPGGTKLFTELVALAGLATPFGDEALDSVCKVAGKWLEEYDLGEIR